MMVEERGEELILKPLDSDYLEQVSKILQTGGKLSKKLLAERKLDRGKRQ